MDQLQIVLIDSLRDPNVLVNFVVFAIAIVYYYAIFERNFKTKSDPVNEIANVLSAKKPVDSGSSAIIDLGRVSGQLKSWLYNNKSGHSIRENPSAIEVDVRFGKTVLLSYPDFLAAPLPKNPITYIPAVHTAIGVIGTFWGITVGLQGLDKEALSGATEEALLRTQEGVGDVIGGMQTAFVTSLWGLSLSVACMVWIAFQNQQREKIRNDALRRFNEVAIVDSPTRLLARMGSTQTESVNRELLNVLQDIRATIQNSEQLSGAVIARAVASGMFNVADKQLIPELRKATSQLAVIREQTSKEQVSIKDISEVLDGFTEKVLAPGFGQLMAEVSAIREASANQNSDILRTLIADLKSQVFEPVIERLDQSAHLTAQASEAVTELRNELGEITKSLAVSVKTIQQFQQDTLIRLEEFAGSLKQTLQQFQDETNVILRDVAQEIRNGVDQSIEGLKAQRDEFERSSAGIETTFRDIGTHIKTSMEQQTDAQQVMLERVNGQAQGILEKSQATFDQQSQTLKDVGSHAQQLMESVAQEIRNGVDQSIEGLKAQRGEFERCSAGIETTFRDIGTHIKISMEQQTDAQQVMLDRVNERAQGILEESQATFNQQSQTLKDVGSHAQQLMESARQNLESTLGNIDTMLQQTRLTVQEELSNFRVEYQAALNKFFQDQNQMLEGTLGSQREGLQKVIDSLDSVFKEEATLIKQSMDDILSTTKHVTELLNQTGFMEGGRVTQLTELTHRVARQMSDLQKTYADLTHQLQEVLNSSQTHVRDTIDVAWRHEEAFFQKADQSMSNLMEKMLVAADYLVAAEQDRQSRLRG